MEGKQKGQKARWWVEGRKKERTVEVHLGLSGCGMTWPTTLPQDLKEAFSQQILDVFGSVPLQGHRPAGNTACSHNLGGQNTWL